MRLLRPATGIGVALATVFLSVTAGTIELEAQRGQAVRRQAVRRPARVPARRGYVSPRYYRPYRYGYGYYDPFFYGPYLHGPYAYPAYGYYPHSSVRLQIKPVDAEVFVDGYYAGVVDSFDGIFQRLRLPPGEHVIEVYLEGHETIRETLFLTQGETYRIERAMEPLDESAPPPIRPEPQPFRAPPSSGAARGATAAPGVAAEMFGTLVIRTQPVDAEVRVNGERWLGADDTGELILDAGVGVHTVEVSKLGFRPYRVEVEVVASEPTVINVSLPPTGP